MARKGFFLGTFRWTTTMVTLLLLCTTVDCVDPIDVDAGGATCDCVDKAIEAFANWLGGRDSAADCTPLPFKIKVLICVGHVSAVLLVLLACFLGTMKCIENHRSKKMQVSSSPVQVADSADKKDEEAGYYYEIPLN